MIARSIGIKGDRLLPACRRLVAYGSATLMRGKSLTCRHRSSFFSGSPTRFLDKSKTWRAKATPADEWRLVL